MTFFHTQHIELNFKYYFRNGDSLVLAKNGRNFSNFSFDKELGNIDNIILWSYKISYYTISIYRCLVCLQYHNMGLKE